MQKKYSWYSLLKAGLSNQEWDKAIPLCKPKSKYDVIIIGGGGHGLATAYYLAKECGINNVAVLKRDILAVEIPVETLQLLGQTISEMKRLVCMSTQ